MIRQLRRLTRPVPALAPGAQAIAVYAEARGDILQLRAAAESGIEGVACVDDAARAAVLWCRLWQRGRVPGARVAAGGLLRFLAAMQTEDGSWANFILDWRGTINLAGPTSRPGNHAWTFRAMEAVATAAVVFGPDGYAEQFRRGLPWLEMPTPYLDLRAVAVRAALTFASATGDEHVARHAVAWAEEIAAARVSDILPDQARQTAIHAWGHVQEAALAEAGMAAGRPDLIEAARRSAETVLMPLVESAFEGSRTMPFDVSSVVAGLDAVARATGEPRYAGAADAARAWFSGRNSAGAPMYDARLGLVYDGIDDGVINRNSGAESNIEGGLALLDMLVGERTAMPAQ